MRSAIACSADSLRRLTAEMIQSIVDRSSYNSACQYIKENRVRLLEWSGVSLRSSVVGRNSAYQQVVELKAGTLFTQCSCDADGASLCRHSIAALLEFLRWSANRAEDGPPAGDGRASASAENPRANTAADINFRDLAAFLEWFQVVLPTLEMGGTLPAYPSLSSNEAQSWIGAICRTHARYHAVEEERKNLRSERATLTESVDRLTNQLRDRGYELETFQARHRALEKELIVYREALNKIAKSTEVFRAFADQTRRFARALDTQRSELDSLSEHIEQSCTDLDRTASPVPARDSAEDRHASRQEDELAGEGSLTHNSRRTSTVARWVSRGFRRS